MNMVDASNLLSLPRVRQNYAYFAFFLAITVALLAILGQKDEMVQVHYADHLVDLHEELLVKQRMLHLARRCDDVMKLREEILPKWLKSSHETSKAVDSFIDSMLDESNHLGQAYAWRRSLEGSERALVEKKEAQRNERSLVSVQEYLDKALSCSVRISTSLMDLELCHQQLNIFDDICTDQLARCFKRRTEIVADITQCGMRIDRFKERTQQTVECMDEIAEVRNQTEFCRKETIEWQEDHMIVDESLRRIEADRQLLYSLIPAAEERRACKEMWRLRPKRPERFAFVSLITNKKWLLPVYVLGMSIDRTNSLIKRKILLVTNDVAAPGSTAQTRLDLLGWETRTIEKIADVEVNMKSARRQELYTKLNLFKYDVLRDFEKVLYLDADTVVLDNVDHLFPLTEGHDFSAVREIFPRSIKKMVPRSYLFECDTPFGWNPRTMSYGSMHLDIFNSGVMLFKPKPNIHEDLVVLMELQVNNTNLCGTGQLSGEKCKMTHQDQLVLNRYFQDRTNYLPQCYNRKGEPRLAGYPSTEINKMFSLTREKLFIEHFFGNFKPWRNGKRLQVESKGAVLAWGNNSFTQTLDYLRTFLHAAGVNVFDAEEYDWDDEGGEEAIYRDTSAAQKVVKGSAEEKQKNEKKEKNRDANSHLNDEEEE